MLDAKPHFSFSCNKVTYPAELLQVIYRLLFAQRRSQHSLHLKG